ncbi:glycosyltransferase [Planctomicrobium sp. SH668]|uniref:glycosyltransferase n=1 Tax=Planctomicrobium sp. SH668 TaxID=3448126 RepID=UPI003F5C865D
MPKPKNSPENDGTSNRSPRRIAFCITDLDSGGAERAMVQIVTRLDRKNWDPIVLCLGPEAVLAPVLREQGIPTQCYGARSWRDLGAIFWLRRQLKLFQPAILQCFLFHANIIGRIAGKLGGVPVVVAGHRVAEKDKKWHLSFEKWTGSLVTHHLCVSSGVANFLSSELGISPSKMTVIPNGVEQIPPQPDDVDLRREFGFPQDAQVVLAVGRLHPQKGFLNLLDSFSVVSRSRPESRCLIVGEGPQRPLLEQRIRELGLGEVARLAGIRGDVQSLMRQSTLLAVTSLWEGMPNVVLEAMANRLPVVTTNVEGIAELIEDHHSGIIVSPFTTDDFSQAMLEIVDSPEFGNSLGRMAQELVAKEFSWDSVVGGYESTYARLID